MKDVVAVVVVGVVIEVDRLPLVDVFVGVAEEENLLVSRGAHGVILSREYRYISRIISSCFTPYSRAR